MIHKRNLCTAGFDVCADLCVDTATDASSCGGCGIACPATDANGAGCAGSVCQCQTGMPLHCGNTADGGGTVHAVKLLTPAAHIPSYCQDTICAATIRTLQHCHVLTGRLTSTTAAIATMHARSARPARAVDAPALPVSVPGTAHSRAPGWTARQASDPAAATGKVVMSTQAGHTPRFCRHRGLQWHVCRHHKRRQ